jgi:hypothetical protein
MMIHTTTAIQGKEANTAFYSLVIANGGTEVVKNGPQLAKASSQR